MTTPARKAAPKKAPAKRTGSAAVAARREVRTEKNPAVKYSVPFRGETFVITLDKLATQKIYWREKAIEAFPNADSISALLFELLGQQDSRRFINLMGPGDDNILTPASEFLAAFRKTSADPNS